MKGKVKKNFPLGVAVFDFQPLGFTFYRRGWFFSCIPVEAHGVATTSRTLRVTFPSRSAVEC